MIINKDVKEIEKILWGVYKPGNGSHITGLGGTWHWRDICWDEVENEYVDLNIKIDGSLRDEGGNIKSGVIATNCACYKK